MGVIQSPLGALGALMVLLEAVLLGALVPLRDQPTLQTLVVYALISSVGLITLLVAGLIVFFAIRRPGLLFNPRDIDPSVHAELYGPEDTLVPTQPYGIFFELEDGEGQETS